MLDDIREWVSDNLRYILLGLAAVLLLVIIIFVVRLFGGSDDKKDAKKPDDKKKQTEAVTESPESESGTEAADDVELTQNDPAILEVMTRYYNAYAEKDFETLRAIDPAFSAEDEAILQNNNTIERYDNIMVYSCEGLKEGSYIVYSYCDAKVVGITTLAPSLNDDYLETNAEGNLVIADEFSSQELIDYMEKMQASAAVQKLVSDVNRKLKEAADSDPELDAYIVSMQPGTADGDGTDGSGTDGNVEGAPAVDSTVKANATLNVRGDASSDGVLYGVLGEGMTATVLENRNDGWSKIRYTANGVTIEGYVMTQYLTEQ